MALRRLRLVPRTPYIGRPTGEELACQSGTAAVSTTNVAHANEPSGYAAVNERLWTAASDAAWTNTSIGNLQAVTASTDSMASQFTRSAGAVVRCSYPTTTTVGSGRSNTGYLLTGSGRSGVYLDMDLAFSNPWDGPDNGISKFVWVTAGSTSGAPGVFTPFGTDNGSGALTFQFRMQSCPPNKGGNASDGTQNVNCGTFPRGTKVRLVAYLVMNSVDGSGNANADGALFVATDIGDGSGLVVRKNLTTMAYRGNDSVSGSNFLGPTALFTEVKWNGTYGTSGTQPAQLQYQYVGYSYISKSPT